MNDIEKFYEGIVKDVNKQLDIVTKELEKDYNKFNQDFKNKYGISYDNYYEEMVEFYEGE